MAVTQVEVIAPVFAGVKHCQQCTPYLDDAGLSERVNAEAVDSYPEEMWQDYRRLSGVVRDLASRYGSGLRIVVIDPRTPMGLWKSLRHWVRSYPTFIVNGKHKCSGWDLGALDRLLRAGGAGV